GPEALHRRLAGVDPASAARLHPNDVRRVVRALEVWELTGRPISSWQQQWPQDRGSRIEDRGSRKNCLASILDPRSSILDPVLWLAWPGPELYARIARRVEEMFAAGLVDEVRSLGRLPRPLGREAAQALGYKEVLAHLDGRAGLAETVALVQRRSRN